MSPEQVQTLPIESLRIVARNSRRIAQIDARSNLLYFARYIKPEYRQAWFQVYLCNILTDFVEGRIKRLMVIMPPGYAKSEYVSRLMPPFAFGRNPNHKILATSYGADLASSFNRDVQRIIDSEEYASIFPNVSLSAKNVRTITATPLRNSDIFEIPNYQGFYKSSGVGGSITGRRFSLGIIDDYVKGFEEAWSPVYREKVWNWYKTDFYSRALPDAGICIIATRWHPEDLMGKLLTLAESDPNADQWTVIRFPIIIESEEDLSDYDPRKVGELLWGERYGVDHYLATKAMYDSFQFAALYQGRPTAREGNLFKRAWYLQPNGQPFNAYPLNGHVRKVSGYFDLGASDNPNADETAGSLMLSTSTEYFVLDVSAGRWSPAERDRQILATCLRWNSLYPQIRIDIENGIGLGIDSVNNLIKLLIANGINAHTDSVRQSKYIRATAQKDSFLAASENKLIHFVDAINGEWIEPTLLQLSRLMLKETATGIEFTGDHDDRLDCIVGNFNKHTKPTKTNWLSMN